MSVHWGKRVLFKTTFYWATLQLLFLIFFQNPAYAQTTEVIESGVGGHTSGQMLHRINNDVLAHNPTITLVLAGTNDMLNAGKLATFSEFESNLRSIINQLLAQNSEVILMTAPPCVEAKLFENNDPAIYEPEGPNGRLDAANEIIVEVASDNNLLLVDMHELFDTNMSLMSNDGVHPNTSGYNAMVALLHSTIEDNCLPAETIVCFGNSITRNYAPLFADKVEESPFNCLNTCATTSSKIEAECYDDMIGITTEASSEGTDNIGNIHNADWAVYYNIDLTDAYSVKTRVATVKDGVSIEVRLDAVDGDLLATVPVMNTGDWQTWATEQVNIGLVDGVHDVYFVFTGSAGGLLNVNWFGFSEEFLCSNTPSHIEAECYDDMSGIQTEDCSEGTLNVGWINNGDWLMYEDIDLSGMNSIKARVSGKTTGSIIEIHIDAIDGDLIAEIPVTNTSGNQNWITDSIGINSVTETHDVYLVFKGETGYLFNINYFGFSEENLIITDFNKATPSQLDIYPNPTNGMIQFPTECTYQFADAFGNIVRQGFGISATVSDVPDGIYFLKIRIAEQSFIQKIIKH